MAANLSAIVDATTARMKFLTAATAAQAEVAKKTTKELNSLEQAMERLDATSTGFDKRTKILNKSILQVANEGAKGFELFSKRARKAYMDLGGTRAEFYAEFLSSSKEELKIMGFEAAKLRKVMYGFLPPGTFRLLNKFSSSLQFIGGIQRSMRDAANDTEEEYGNLFKTLSKVGLGFKKFLGLRKDSLVQSKMEARYGQGGRKLLTRGQGGKLGLNLRSRGRAAFERGSFSDFIKNNPVLDNAQRFVSESRERTAAGKQRLSGLRGQLRASEKQGRTSYSAGVERSKLKKKIKMEETALKGEKKFRMSQKKVQFKQLQSFAGKTKFAKFIMNVGKLVKLGMLGLLKGFVIFSLVIVGIFLVLKALWPSLKEAFKSAFKAIKEASGPLLAGIFLMVEGVKGIFNAFFGDGDLESLIDSLLILLGGILIAQFGLLKIILVGLFEFLKVFIKDLLIRVKDFFMQSGEVAKKVAVVAAVLVGIAAFIAGAPVLLAAAVGAAIYYVVKKLLDFVAGEFSFGNLFKQKRANGGIVTSPVTMVGETGPELVSLPRGSRVHSNKDSKQMMGNTFNITINARDTSNSELRRIAEEIGRMVNSKVNRSATSRTLG
tara:strand:- start:1281 stop:3098 length:1818 start_codon:yes stop_codon:yes gene_type:complete